MAPHAAALATKPAAPGMKVPVGPFAMAAARPRLADEDEIDYRDLKSLVGRRATLLWAEDEASVGKMYAATCVACNDHPLCKGRGRLLFHFDDGLVVRQDVPDEGVCFLASKVGMCTCKECAAADVLRGGKDIPCTWVARA